MKIGVRRLCGLIGSIILCIFGVGADAQTVEDENGVNSVENEHRYALLVGISDYEERQNPVPACRTNVKKLREVLESPKYRFKTKTLPNDKAKKGAIEEAFNNFLIGGAEKAAAEQKEAAIVFYFCGHGRQKSENEKDINDKRDPKPDEPDGKDETLVAWDSGNEENVPDILDDEIDYWVSNLRKFTKNTTLIFESCHSGTSARSGGNGPVAHEAKPDTNKLPRPATEMYEKFTPSPSDAKYFTSIGAARSREKAWGDSPKSCNCDEPMSYMTAALVDTLRKTDPTRTTYLELVRQVRLKVKKKKNRQTPMLDGNRDRLVFGGGSTKAPPYISILDIGEGKSTIEIAAGYVEGVSKGSIVNICAPGTEACLPDKGFITSGTVKAVDKKSSTVELSDLGRSNLVSDRSRVFMATPLYGGEPISLLLDIEGDDPSGDHQSVKEEIKAQLGLGGLMKSGLFKIVSKTDVESDSEPNLLALRVGKFGNIFETENDYQTRITPRGNRVVCDGDQLKILTRENRQPRKDEVVYYLVQGTGIEPLFGRVFRVRGNSKLAAEIADAARDYAFKTNLLGMVEGYFRKDRDPLESNKYGFALEVKKIPANARKYYCEEDELELEPIDTERTEVVPNDGKVEIGSVFQVSITNKTIGDRRFNLILISPNGKIRIISLGTERLLQNRSATIKKSFEVDEPVGTAHILVVGTFKEADFRFLESNNVARSRNAGMSLLQRLLTQSNEITARDGKGIKYKPDMWTIKQFDLEFCKKGFDCD